MTDRQPGYPIINNNGSTAESLGNDRIAAWRAVKEAMKALSECAPHGRDYHTEPGAEYAIARKRYAEHFAALDKLANELCDEIQYLADLKK
jgi:hypothetical protein